MPTYRGFNRKRLDGSPAMTVGQKEFVRQAVRSVTDFAKRKNPQLSDRLDEAFRALSWSLDQTADDRSCFSCDYFYDSVDDGKLAPFCSLWKQNIPDGREHDGCDRHQDDGTPF